MTPPPSCLRDSARGSRRGYTLLETLVVFSVLAILLISLLAVSGRLKASGRLAACTQNLRALHVAFTLFTQEHHHDFTSSRWDHPSTEPKLRGLRDYLSLSGSERHPTAMTCPELQAGPYPSGRPMCANYGINTRATKGYHVNSLEKATLVTLPSRFLLFSEGVVNPLPGSTVKSDYNYYVAISWGQEQAMQWIHDGRQNAIFLDGHVRLLSPSDLPSGKLAYLAPLWSGSEP